MSKETQREYDRAVKAAAQAMHDAEEGGTALLHYEDLARPAVEAAAPHTQNGKINEARERAERAEAVANDALRNYWNQHEELAWALERADRAEAALELEREYIAELEQKIKQLRRTISWMEDKV